MLHKNLKTDISILKFSLLDLNQILKIKLLDFMFQACVCFFQLTLCWYEILLFSHNTVSLKL